MSTNNSPYRCEKHGKYTPAFNREIDGYVCPRVICEICEYESYDKDVSKRPRGIKYFYKEKMAVILQEAHNGSAIWKFDPPVIYPEWHFNEDLTPEIPAGALTAEESMERMEKLLPEIERIARENGIGVPDAKDILIMPGKGRRVNS